MIKWLKKKLGLYPYNWGKNRGKGYSEFMRYQNQRYFLNQLEERLIKERLILKRETERYIKMQDAINNPILAKKLQSATGYDHYDGM